MLDFSPFKIVTEAVTGPDGKAYTLRSASAGAGIKYQAAQFGARRARGKAEGDAAADAPGPAEYEKILEAELVLISSCLRDGDGDAVPVPALLNDWPHAVRAELYDWVVAHSPELIRRSKDSLLRERELLDRQLATLEGGGDPKVSPSSGGASST